MLKQFVSLLPFLLVFLCTTPVLSQSPAQAPVAQPPAASLPPLSSPPSRAPAASGPPNITAILEGAGHFDTFIKLLQSTQMDAFITKNLNDSSQSLTIFAPDDNAFGNLRTGTLNSFNEQQKVQLIKFHMISSFLSFPGGFQTVSNPMSTEAGSSIDYQLNVSTTGNLVNLTSGVVKASILATVHSDNKLAVYKVDQVLLPSYFFKASEPAPASPEPAVKKAPKAPKAPLAPPVSTASDDNGSVQVQPSAAIRVTHHSLNAIPFSCFLITVLYFRI
ncbi:hypothetical protein NMG60_11000534 [Bertholletia excelsa]